MITESPCRALAGIEPYEVRQVLDAKRRSPRPATGATGLPVLTIWRRTQAGRPLIVAVYHVADLTWKVVGARDMTAVESAEFDRWDQPISRADALCALTLLRPARHVT